ncbi:glycoside hydrolase family 16 protein [Bradyrhizobium yuanmingense]|uniref:glycoside hydrolase family 16 protein n=1 Tax=Bradyrhizobium yuanmingense TaxID=108015 RepID=UPI0023B9731C|nr:glycoside hydrolase family 16 protein [Bradyrhizobium yuanmingense]MDF0578890.1 glycoside hydrolase family 16 protein [Bradyrhizobium yuanmingense]
MRKLNISLLFTACFLSFVPLFASQTARASGWKIVFEDNFDGSSLDRAKWATRYIYGGETTDHLNDEIERYRDNGNHVLHDGQLDLVARRAGTDRYESGMIRSLQTFYYGYFEARVFLPKGRGIWPAFWLNSDYDQNGKLSWPPEIDIFEYVVNGVENVENMVHSSTPNSQKEDITYHHKNFNLRWMDYSTDGPLNEHWHVFGLVWTPENIAVFLDGVLLYKQNYKWLRRDGSFAPPAHILLNFAIGGKWAGRHGIDHDRFPQSLQIDYVRVCQFTKEDSGQRFCGDSRVTPDPAIYGYVTAFNDMEKVVLGNAAIAVDNAPVAEVSIRAGTELRTQLQIFFPKQGPQNSGLSLALRKSSLKQDAHGSNQTFPIDAHQVNSPVSLVYKVPKTIPEGEYYLTAQLLPEYANPAPNLPIRAPLRCQSDFDTAVKALSCNVAKLKIVH